jgi:hypothetical protein
LQEAFGVEVIESRHAKADIHWLAAHPEARAVDLMQPASAPGFSGRNAARRGRWSSQTCCVVTLKCMKGYRRIFSRFEKLDVVFLGFLSFAFIVEALR